MRIITACYITVVRWNDNNIVTLAPNANAIHPKTLVNHNASIITPRTKIAASRFEVISMYYKYMGWVDKFDKNADNHLILFMGNMVVPSLCFWH